MRKLLLAAVGIVAVVAIVASGISASFGTKAAHGQDSDEASLRYSVVFNADVQAGMRYTYIASLYSDGRWEVTQLDDTLFFEDLQKDYPTLQWSADGLTLFATVRHNGLETELRAPTSLSSALIVNTYTGPTWQRDISLEVPAAENLPEGAIEVLTPQTVSPDGKYAWVNMLMGQGPSRLVELASGETIFSPECPGLMLEWVGEVVVISNQTSDPTICPPDVYTYNLTTGEIISLADAEDTENLYVLYAPEGVYLPKTNAILVGSNEFPARVGLLGLDGSWGGYLGLGADFGFSEDETYITYMDWNQPYFQLVRLNLVTNELEVLDEYVLGSSVWEGNTLTYWKDSQVSNAATLVRVQITGDERVEEIIVDESELPADGFVGMSAADVYMALPYESAEVIQEVSARWQATIGWPNGSARLEPYTPHLLAGEWVWLTAGYQVSGMERRYALNLETFELLTPPEPSGGFVSVAPDGAWLLYSSLEQDATGTHTRLMAYEPASGKTVELWQGRSLLQAITPSMDDGSYLYNWSPLVTPE